MKSDVRISLFQFLASQLHQVFAEPFSLLGRPSRLSVLGVSGDFLSLNECTTFLSRSLFPFDCELKKKFEQQVLHICTSFLNARTIVNRLMPVSRGSHPKILTLWELCLLRFACCYWMLPHAENLLDLRWLWWRRHGTGNFYDCRGD